jgi:hypothetical protein
MSAPRLVRHRARGTTYRVLGEAEVQMSKATMVEPIDGNHVGRFIKESDRLIVYEGVDGRLWARFPDEFNDGRFEEMWPP